MCRDETYPPDHRLYEERKYRADTDGFSALSSLTSELGPLTATPIPLDRVGKPVAKGSRRFKWVVTHSLFIIES